MRTRLLNDELKPRALIATDVIPTWMKSSPFTSFSAPAKLLPIELSITSVPMLVIVAGASVTFSTRRDADTTMTPRVLSAAWTTMSARASCPPRTVTPEVTCGCCPSRCTRRSQVPAGTPATR
jgi:hypothetical protein